MCTGVYYAGSGRGKECRLLLFLLQHLVCQLHRVVVEMTVQDEYAVRGHMTLVHALRKGGRNGERESELYIVNGKYK